MQEALICKSAEESAEKIDIAKLAKLDAIIDKNARKKGALITVLHQAQELFGHLPKSIQKHIAEGLNVPESEVYGVVTFYSYFTMEPKGRHKIGVCLGTACYVKGAASVLEAIKRETGIDIDNTSKDGRFSLGATRCVGACGLAPVVTVGEDVYGKVTPDQIPEILAKYK